MEITLTESYPSSFNFFRSFLRCYYKPGIVKGAVGQCFRDVGAGPRLSVFEFHFHQ